MRYSAGVQASTGNDYRQLFKKAYINTIFFVFF